MFILWFYAT